MRGELLEGGDATNGRDIVTNHLAANCLACHTVEAKEGSQVGPNGQVTGDPIFTKGDYRVKDGSPALVDGLEGRKSLELITAIYESIESGREVALKFAPRKSRLGEKR